MGSDGEADGQRFFPGRSLWAECTGAHGFLWIEHEKIGTKDYLRIVQNHYADLDALKRQLHFMASLRDQYLAVVERFRPIFR